MSSFETALANAENRNFFIEKNFLKEIYYDICLEKVIEKYNKLLEKIVLKSKH